MMIKIIADSNSVNATAVARTLNEAKMACGAMLENLGVSKKDITIIMPDGKKMFLVKK
jgi:hypothetical protein